MTEVLSPFFAAALSSSLAAFWMEMLMLPTSYWMLGIRSTPATLEITSRVFGLFQAWSMNGAYLLERLVKDMA